MWFFFRMKENQVASLKKDLDVLNVNFGEALENNVKSDEESRKIIETLSQNNKEVYYDTINYIKVIL